MRRNIWLLALAQALLLTGSALVASTAALVGKELSPYPLLATLPLAAQLVGTMLTTIPAALLMARIGRRAGFSVGAALGLAGAIIATFAVLGGRFYLFSLGTALIGVFNGFGVYYRFAAADAATPSYRSRAVSYVLAGGVVAAVAGPSLARWTRTLIGEAEFAGSFLGLVGVYAVAVFIPLLTTLRKPEETELAAAGRPLVQVARQPAYLVAVIAATMGYAFMVLLMTATPLAMDAKAFTFGLIAFVIQGHVLGMYAPSFVTGGLIGRLGVLQVMLLGATLGAAAVAVNLAGTSGVHFTIALVLLGVAWNFLFIGGTTLLTETYRPAERAKAQALNDFTVWTAVVAASLSAGALQQAFGWRAVNLGAIPLILIAAGAVGWLWLKRRGMPGPLTAGQVQAEPRSEEGPSLEDPALIPGPGLPTPDSGEKAPA